MIKGLILAGVGKNMNRAIRTCYSFGVYDIYCLKCKGFLKGSLFSAKDKVRLHAIDSLEQFDPAKILALELTNTLPSIRKIDTSSIEYIAIGGEAITLRKKDFPVMARIPTKNKLCLTVEAALAIALYEVMK